MGQIEDSAQGGAENRAHDYGRGVEDANERLRDPERLRYPGKWTRRKTHLLEQGGREDLAEIGAEAGGHSRWKVQPSGVAIFVILGARLRLISIVIGGALGVP